MNQAHIHQSIDRIIESAHQLKHAARAIEDSEQLKRYKNFYDWANEYLKEVVEDAQETVEDYRAAGLSINAVEAEGFLRACMTIKNYFDDVIGRNITEDND